MKVQVMSMPEHGKPGSGKPQPGLTQPNLALLGSLCLFLSAIEYVVPKPLPFMRIGLANLPLLLALDFLGPVDFFLLALLKVLGQAVISGSLFSYVFLFSAAGTFTSALVMYALRHLAGVKQRGGSFGFAGIGCAGAMVSNGVQLLLARHLVFGAAIQYLAPPFLASGFISGIALGVFCELFCRRSRWYAVHTGAGGVSAESSTLDIPMFIRETRRLQRQERWNRFFGGGELCAAALIMTLLFVCSPSMPARVVQFAFFCLLAWFSGRKIKPLVTLSVMAGIVFFNLLAPYGKVLVELGPLRITQGSLLAGIGKALTVEGLLMLSSACIKSDLRLPGKLGALLAESFSILELLRKNRRLVRRGAVIAGIDNLILTAEAQAKNSASTPKPPDQRKPRRIAAARLILLAMALLTAAASIAFTSGKTGGAVLPPVPLLELFIVKK